MSRTTNFHSADDRFITVRISKESFEQLRECLTMAADSPVYVLTAKENPVIAKQAHILMDALKEGLSKTRKKMEVGRAPFVSAEKLARREKARSK